MEHLINITVEMPTVESKSPMKNLVESLLNCVKTRRPINQISNSIDMVPSGLRDLSPSSFNPRVVSIGPLHREDENLKAFEPRKATYMHDLLRSLHTDMEQVISECVQVVLVLMPQIRASYACRFIIPYDDFRLAQMMVVDACFILQVIRTLSLESSFNPENWFTSPSIVYDLVLIENQIPFFILEKIFDCTLGRFQGTASFYDHILKLVNVLNMLGTKTIVSNKYPLDYDHILGFIEKCYWSPKNNKSILLGLPSSEIHSTVELDRARVMFKPNQGETWPMAIEFEPSMLCCCSWSWGKPTLRMPVLRIHSFTEVILRNLIAYDYSSRAHGFFTSYAIAMDMLVDTQDDISKLIESKVVVNHLGSNDKAAKMINSLCKELPLLNFYYVQQWKQLDTHYNSYWPRNIASLKRTYFSSPWNIIALFAGIVLFALTVVQTIAAF